VQKATSLLARPLSQRDDLFQCRVAVFRASRNYGGSQPRRKLQGFRPPRSGGQGVHETAVWASGPTVPLVPLGGRSGRSHKETWAACIASLTNEGSSSLSASITLHAWVAVPTHHSPTRELAPATPTRHLISPLLPR
jgi:hypothetical protein